MNTLSFENRVSLTREKVKNLTSIIEELSSSYEKREDYCINEYPCLSVSSRTSEIGFVPVVAAVLLVAALVGGVVISLMCWFEGYECYATVDSALYKNIV